MTSRIGSIWPLEPHTKAKHEILSYYLKAWFPILATAHRRLLYIDGFAGPGEYAGGEDGSPILALKVALEHKLKHIVQRPGMEIVFIFIERDESRFRNLQDKLARMTVPASFRVEARCGSFSEVFDEALREIEEQNRRLAPSFIFIDPFGPTGFPMALLSRIAQQPSSEVLLNFQYQSLNQWFLRDSSKHEHLTELYGDGRWRPALNITDSRDKEVYLRGKYKEALEDLGWRVRPFRMVNKHNQTQCYLFFATRNWRGSLVMKGAMWRAAPEGDFEYCDLTDPHPKLFLLPEHERYSSDLADRLHRAYRGQTVPKEKLVQEDLAWDDVCIEHHLTGALKILEYERTPGGIMGVQVPGGRKRRQGTYPQGCLICFAP